MATQAETRQLYAELTEKYGRKVADAFLEAVADIQARVDLRRVIDAIARGDIPGAIDALHLDPAAYGKLQDAIAQAFTDGGTVAAQGFPARTPDGLKFVVRFDARDPAAEAWLKQQSSGLVTRIVEDQRNAIRGALMEGLVAGANPRATALDIVGRQNRVTGKREGGLLGLTASQTEWATRYAEELAGVKPSPNALNRQLRDKRFDRTVAKAIREGTPIPAETQARMVTAYRNKALKLRGDTIGKAETFTALAAARHESYRQAVESGKVTASQVKKTWRHFASENPRMQHIAMAGRSVGLDEPFVLPDGTRMLYPHDPDAPAGHTIGCKCQADYKIDWLTAIR